ncbi:MAG: hypothetical protein ACK6CE_06230, partial [Planctomycetota bacterium]
MTLAHEGHAPLRTKGVDLVVAMGLVTLSPEGMRNVGLQTVAVGRESVEEVLTFNGMIDLPPG